MDKRTRARPPYVLHAIGSHSHSPTVGFIIADTAVCFNTHRYCCVYVINSAADICGTNEKANRISKEFWQTTHHRYIVNVSNFSQTNDTNLRTYLYVFICTRTCKMVEHSNGIFNSLFYSTKHFSH